jgi:hypothetical protein
MPLRSYNYEGRRRNLCSSLHDPPRWLRLSLYVSLLLLPRHVEAPEWFSFGAEVDKESR